MEDISFDEFPAPGSRYSLLDPIGEGAFGRVFAAIDSQASQKTVAIKGQKITESHAAILKQEYTVLRDVADHSNIANFYGVYKQEDDLWFVLEMCEGGSVIDLVRALYDQNRRMNEEHIAYIVKEAVRGISYLHDRCVIHRDIKAKNILLTASGEVKITDFGLSASTTVPLGKTVNCVGSPAWMAPEVINFKKTQEDYDNRVDVWSLGITAIELGDGKAPYQNMHPSRALFQISSNPPPNLYRTSNWSLDYVDFINECLIKNPDHRPYIMELIDHPFLTQIPDNNYHLTLEIKAMIEETNKLNLPKYDDAEIALIGDLFKMNFDSGFKNMLVEDLASLNKINEKNVMDLLKERYEIENYYSFVGDVLVALNLNENQDIYGEKYHEKYRFKSRSDNAPHIYAVADSAYQNALHHKTPQRIVLSGESGSGKTTNYFHLVNHLLFLGENKNVNLERLKNAIQLIHFFTHASTPVNSNSTRCVFKTDIKYGATGKVSGAHFNVEQLEKWRVSSVDMNQKIFHIFYHWMVGLGETKNAERFRIQPSQEYRYLRLENPTAINKDENLKKFKLFLKVAEEFEFGEHVTETILSILSAILNIGELRIQESDIGEAIIENGEYVENVAELLKVEANKLEWGLTNFCVVNKAGAVRRRKTVDETRNARDVLANTLYSRLVDYIVNLINYKLAFGKAIFGEKYSIKIFDYFGFECFANNDLSQLYVNCFNEQLQYHYLQRVFSWECLDAIEEEVIYQPINYYDNKDTLDQLLGKDGLFTYIDDASKTGQNGAYFLELLEESNKNKVKMLTCSEFTVAHYTGKVTYNAKEMPDKNRDFLHSEITESLRLSDNLIVKMLFTNKLDKTGNLIMCLDQNNEIDKRRYKFSKNATNEYSQITKPRTSISTFKALSLEMLKELSIGSGSGGTHFVRCIRTDLKNQKNFNEQLVKQQIRALAVAETAQQRQIGYPHRISFSEFLRRYQLLAFDFNESVEMTKDNCRLLLIRLKLEEWNIGKSKVFLKYYNEEYLSRLYETHVKKIIQIQSILRRFLTKCRVSKQIKEQQNVAISRIGSQQEKRFTEEEAASIIQKAYRISNIRKSYPDFAKDYDVLDEDTCQFIQPFADKWRKNSLFHVLVLYRTTNIQDSFNFSQQVHFYNIGIFYELQLIEDDVSLNVIDEKAQVSNWLLEIKVPVRKVPFRLNEIPFCDTSTMLNALSNLGSSIDTNESWDSPYRWRELVSSKSVESTEMVRTEDQLTTLPYVRDPTIPTVELLTTDDVDSEPQTENPIQISIVVEKSVPLKDDDSEALEDNEDSGYKINSISKPANEDFNYIKSPVRAKPKKVDPIAELKQMSQKNVSDDEPPFNFKGMLRKTNYQKENNIKPQIEEENTIVYPLKKTYFQKDAVFQNKKEETVQNLIIQNKDNINANTEIFTNNQINGHINGEFDKSNYVKLEIAPGIIIEGIEVNL